MITLTLMGILVVAVVVKKMMAKRYNMPPGPKGLPFLGNFMQLDGKFPHKTITKWAEEYGEVVKMGMFGDNFVILNSYDTIYEAMITKALDYAGRPDFFRAEVIRNYHDSITFTTYSRRWAFMKKTSMQALKMYGDNLENLELITLDLLQDLMVDLREVAKQHPGGSNIKPIVHTCVTNIISSIMYGHKVSKKDAAQLQMATDKNAAALEPTGIQILLDVFPLTRYILRSTYRKLLDVRDLTESWFKHEISERKKHHEPGNPQCVLDALYEAQRKGQKNNAEFQIDEGAIYGLNLDLIFAGTVTTSTSLHVLIGILVNMPEIQDKMFDIIMKEIGTREPRLKDRSTLGYVEAAVLEMLRYSSILPLNITHCTITDTTIKGYDVPKNTRIMYNLWKLHHDPQHWDDPWEFKPERFLDEEGALVAPDHINRKRLLAFGASRRVCVGETLAKNRLFLMVTSLIQNFKFLPVSEEERPSHDPRTYISALGIYPKDYSVKLQSRK